MKKATTTPPPPSIISLCTFLVSIRRKQSRKSLIYTRQNLPSSLLQLGERDDLISRFEIYCEIYCDREARSKWYDSALLYFTFGFQGRARPRFASKFVVLECATWRRCKEGCRSRIAIEFSMDSAMANFLSWSPLTSLPEDSTYLAWNSSFRYE